MNSCCPIINQVRVHYKFVNVTFKIGANRNLVSLGKLLKFLKIAFLVRASCQNVKVTHKIVPCSVIMQKSLRIEGKGANNAVVTLLNPMYLQ